MAQGGNEHRMVFDIRGKRRHVVKVVYAILAILMGLSLFLVTGAVNLSSLFETANKANSATAGLLEQSERLERKVRKDPENPALLIALARAQVNTGNSYVEVDQSTGEVKYPPEVQQELAKASESWSRYLKATNEPSVSGAQVMAPALFTLAELSGSNVNALQENVKAATQAQRIVAKQRPNLNSLSLLATYQLFAFDFAGAKKSEEAAKKFATNKFDRENLENQLKEYSKRAHEFQKQVNAEAKAAKEGAAAGGGKEALENPFGGLGGAGLGE